MMIENNIQAESGCKINGLGYNPAKFIKKLDL